MEDQEIVSLLKKLIKKERVVGFKQLCDDYLSIYVAKRKRSAKKDRAYIDRFLLPEFGNRSLSEIRTGDIQRLHSKISEATPTTANRVIEVLSKMYSLAIQWGYYDERNPCASVTHNRERSRDRYLQDQEIKQVMRVLEQERLPVKCLIYMYILTGRRKEELRGLRWEHVDLDTQTMTIHDSKKNEKIFIPIPSFAKELLETIKPEGPLVFSINRQKIGLDRQWRRIKLKAGLTDVTIHDLRRTCATWMFSAGESLDTIRELLNHSSVKTTKIYAKLKREKVASAMERLSDTIRQYAP